MKIRNHEAWARLVGMVKLTNGLDLFIGVSLETRIFCMGLEVEGLNFYIHVYENIFFNVCIFANKQEICPLETTIFLCFTKVLLQSLNIECQSNSEIGNTIKLPSFSYRDRYCPLQNQSISINFILVAQGLTYV